MTCSSKRLSSVNGEVSSALGSRSRGKRTGLMPPNARQYLRLPALTFNTHLIRMNETGHETTREFKISLATGLTECHCEPSRVSCRIHVVTNDHLPAPLAEEKDFTLKLRDRKMAPVRGERLKQQLIGLCKIAQQEGKRAAIRSSSRSPRD